MVSSVVYTYIFGGMYLTFLNVVYSAELKFSTITYILIPKTSQDKRFQALLKLPIIHHEMVCILEVVRISHHHWIFDHK